MAKRTYHMYSLSICDKLAMRLSTLGQNIPRIMVGCLSRRCLSSRSSTHRDRKRPKNHENLLFTVLSEETNHTSAIPNSCVTCLFHKIFFGRQSRKGWNERQLAATEPPRSKMITTASKAPPNIWVRFGRAQIMLLRERKCHHMSSYPNRKLILRNLECDWMQIGISGSSFEKMKIHRGRISKHILVRWTLQTTPKEFGTNTM